MDILNLDTALKQFLRYEEGLFSHGYSCTLYLPPDRNHPALRLLWEAYHETHYVSITPDPGQWPDTGTLYGYLSALALTDAGPQSPWWSMTIHVTPALRSS